MFSINLKSCRICLSIKKPMCPLFNSKNGSHYAEMLTAVANVKISHDDGLPGKICSKCANTLEKAYYLKTVAEKNDKKLHRLIVQSASPITTKKIVFDSIKDIKTEISELTIKNEPKWELDTDVKKPVETIDVKDVVIANTIIRKCDPNDRKIDIEVDLDDSWKTTLKTVNEKDNNEVDFLDEDVFQGDDDDEDYVPPDEHKFKKPKPVVKISKQVEKEIKPMQRMALKIQKPKSGNSATTITCYPIMKNGERGPPITLRRPKDSTTIKTCMKYSGSGSNKPIRIVRPVKPVIKAREKLVCPVCGILTFTLGHHMSTHNEKKKFSCPQCPKQFTQKNNLEAHLKHHNGIKDHICEICGAGFYNQKSLVRHNLIHKGERPFACNLCTKTFIARCDLNRHLRIHSGYKPYKCETCAMSFNAKHQLQNHERMHTGERPYTCQVCNVAFSYKVNLNNHVFKAHGVNLKFKSIHVVTEEVLQKEMNQINEARTAIAHIPPPPAAHETVTMSHSLPFSS